MCEDVDRALQTNGKAASQILDPAADLLEKGKVKVWRVRSFNSGIPCGKTYKINFDLQRIKRRIGFWYKARNLLRRRKVNRARTSRILNRVSFQKMIRRLHPDVIVAIDPSAELCRTARDHRVKIVNVAHGYGYPANCAVHGPLARAKTPPREEPHVFIAFDDITFATRNLGDEGKDTKTLLSRRDFFPEGEVPKEPEKQKRRRKSILVAMQWGYEGAVPELRNIIPDGIMAPALREVIRNSREITWLIKWHPVQIREEARYKKIQHYIRDNLRTGENHVRDVSLEPIHDLLADADLLITMCSMAVYEAAALGVPSLALCPSLQPGGPYAQYFLDLEKEGVLKKIPLSQGKIQEAIFSDFPGKRAGRPLISAPPLHRVIQGLLPFSPAS
jgi:hypothetical protein